MPLALRSLEVLREVLTVARVAGGKRRGRGHAGGQVVVAPRAGAHARDASVTRSIPSRYRSVVQSHGAHPHGHGHILYNMYRVR